MITEQEAREKWCPFARVAQEWLGRNNDPMRPMGPPNDQRMLSASVNRGSYLAAETNCIASQCMAWRWQRECNPDFPVGYCGLAGKP